ncbi:hypothetical protein Agub_g12519, partial [Astrephomene gubernaculifera]
VAAGISPAAAAAAAAAAADGRISLAGLGCGLNSYTYYPLRGSNIMAFYPGSIVVAHVGRLPAMHSPNDSSVPGVACVAPLALRRLTTEVPPPAVRLARGHTMYMPGRFRGSDEGDAAAAAAPAAAAGAVVVTDGGSNGGKDDSVAAAAADASLEGAGARADVCTEGGQQPKEQQQQQQKEQQQQQQKEQQQQQQKEPQQRSGHVKPEAGESEAASRGNCVRVKDEAEREEEEEEELDGGVFSAHGEGPPLLRRRLVYGLLAPPPSANGAAAAARADLSGGGSSGSGEKCTRGGALSTAGCSQVIPSLAFSRRLNAPRLYWGPQYQAHVPPPPSSHDATTGARHPRRPPSPATLALMGQQLHAAQPLSAAAAAVAERNEAEELAAVNATRAELGLPPWRPRRAGSVEARAAAGRPMSLSPGLADDGGDG